ncbi:uncharacterized protein LOC109714881 isoform X1 [Ananas comosus]|uniref:Uncharacterized protein LOC109714881 isoform X1 n=2 Tax=Ananas comosus TaxID=4615 RepID=A0A6P5FGW5_ANACO|nr:uncharacterized protein LOC109714881 isoform X1 [Ananas comosus]XP_020095195.1 uncharacterized protein LOC109714881 isoform X1 [Ananas comosus]CAD1819698.1 unnamed protein product [Ananas comosus var. bracteatus]
MEALYLLFSIASTVATSSLFSLALSLRSLVSLLLPNLSSAAADEGGAAEELSPPPPPQRIRLYEGRVRHERRRPVAHAFDYPVRYALVDLDHAPGVVSSSYSHLHPDRAREVAGSNGPVYLLTIPESVGYEQNPLSIYYCYDLEEEKEDGGGRGDARRCSILLKMCIAEVTNTPWGEKVFFTFRPGSDLVAKPLHVSPFMDMQGNWSIHADEPGEDLSVVISVQHPTLGNYFTATLRAKEICHSTNSVTLAKYFWLMPHKVAMWIYWEALRLWLKNVKFLGHPKYRNPNYRAEALLRDQELSCNKNLNNSNSTSTEGDKKRWCVWRDAQWPWS